MIETMKKFFVLAVVAMMATIGVTAQNVRHDIGTFTLKPAAGLSVGSLGGSFTYYISDLGTRTEFEDEMRGAFVGGVEAEYYILNWLSASGGAYYTMQGWRMKEKVSDTKWNVNLDYLNIPVLANFYVLKGFALKVGVQPGFLLSAKYDGYNIKDQCKGFNLSLPIGLSYEFKNGITIDWNTNFGLTPINKESTNDDNYRSNCAWLTLGYKFSL